MSLYHLTNAGVIRLARLGKRSRLLANYRDREEGVELTLRAPSAFAAAFIAARLSAGLTRKEAARELEVTSRTIEYWESGQRHPSHLVQRGALAMLDAVPR